MAPMNQKRRVGLITRDNLVSLASLIVLVAAATFDPLPWWGALIAGGFLASAISASVHNADAVAHRIGPARGTIVLALSVTVIEVALIISLMGQDSPNAPTVARDTVFAALMIITNGIIGVCLLSGGLKYKALRFQTTGTNSLLGVLTALVGLTLIFPNFTVTTHGPTYSSAQLVFVSAAAILLYIAVVWSQTRAHPDFFESANEGAAVRPVEPQAAPSKGEWTSYVGLLVSLVAVVGLAKVVSPSIAAGLAAVKAPPSTIGIVVALLVLAPETLSAIRAANRGELQTSLNLAIGSAVASIALTIPVVSVYSILWDKPLSLGLDGKSMAFILITLLCAASTFASGRTTALQGCTHLALLHCVVVCALNS